jgi:uncharacterized repeat protein (TIGR04138 family)
VRRAGSGRWRWAAGLAPGDRLRNIGFMTDVQFAEDVLLRLQDRNPRFHRKAYLFLLSALHQVMERLDEPRHISGRELSRGVRDLALVQFGPLARTVLEHWGIHRTEDLGEIVFALVDCGILVKQDEDRREDFREVFDFEEAFELDYPWEAEL